MSCFCCCTPGGQQQKRPSEYSEALKPIVVSITRHDGVQQQGTGILISDHLVLTSHMGLPSKESASDGQIVLKNLGPSNGSPDRWPSSSTILTRKLLPQRLFVTNPGLGLTIVACEPVNSNLSPQNYEVPKAAENGLKLGCSVYVLGQVLHDDQEGLLMFGEGLVSKQHEKVIEFYSLDGYVWAPGSTGFDAEGTFAFVVGDHRPPSNKLSCPLRKRWSYALSKGPSSTQPGILIHAVRDWTKGTWGGDFNTLLQLCHSGPASIDATPTLKQKAEEAQVIERQKTLSKRVDHIQNTARHDTEAIIPRVRGIGPGLENCGNNLYRATDSNSTITSPKIKDIPVQACLLPMPNLVPSSNRIVKVRGLTVKPQSPPKLGGIAALAAEELDRYDEKSELFGSREAGNSLLYSSIVGSVEVDYQNESYDGTPTRESSQDELSPGSCWLSSWWSNFRPSRSQQQQRGDSVHTLAADYSAATEGAGKTEEITPDCLEPDSPPRRFLVRGAYTATPKREFSSTQTSSHITSPVARNVTSPQNIPSPLNNMTQPSSPSRTPRPCDSTFERYSRSLSPETPYLQIHRSPTSGCPRQSDNPWKPPGELDSRRMLPPDPLRVRTGAARTRTYPRDFCPPRSEENDQKKLDEAASRKVSAGAGACMKVVEFSAQQSDATDSQDRIIQSPIAVQTSPGDLCCGENDTLESGFPLDSASASDSTRNHNILEMKRPIREISISRLTRQRVMKGTCIQIWQKFVARRKSVSVESMRSLFSPRTVSVSTASSRSISPSPVLGSPPQTACVCYQLANSEFSGEGTNAADAAAACFLGSPVSLIHDGFGYSEEQAVNASTTQQQPSDEHTLHSPYNESSHIQMPNWAMKQQNIHDETLEFDLSARPRGREDKRGPEAEAQVTKWNGSCIRTSGRHDETGVAAAAEERSPSTASRSEVGGGSSPRLEKYMMTASRKERTDQRKERSNQRPRWSIARIDKGPLNIGSVVDPIDDLSKSSKLRTKNQQQGNDTLTGATAMVSNEEGSVLKKSSGGVRALANEQVEVSSVRKAEREDGQTRRSSPSRKQALNSNSCKAKISSKNSAISEHMTSSPCKPVRSSSKTLLETPPVGKKGSSVSSSSSDREGRPRWR